MKNLKKVLIIYFGDDWHKEAPFLTDRAMGQAYEAWAEVARGKGVELVRASVKWFDKDNKNFKKYWIFENGKWNKKDEKFAPDAVLNKVKIREACNDLGMTKELERVLPLFNSLLFTDLFDNKLNQYLLFCELMPKTFLARTEKRLKEELAKWPQEEKVVVKPLDQSGGTGVQIDLPKKIDLSKVVYPILGQEFIEATAAHLGMPDRLADLRLVFVGDNLSYACSRLAPEGSLLTNFHQGAVLHIVEKEKISKDVWDIVKKVEEKASFFKERIYSIDFLFDKNKGAKMIEMNTKPGVDYFNEKNFNVREKYFNDVLEAINNWLD